jgi:hypothetical protein
MIQTTLGLNWLSCFKKYKKYESLPTDDMTSSDGNNLHGPLFQAKHFSSIPIY